MFVGDGVCVYVLEAVQLRDSCGTAVGQLREEAARREVEGVGIGGGAQVARGQECRLSWANQAPRSQPCPFLGRGHRLPAPPTPLA